MRKEAAFFAFLLFLLVYERGCSVQLGPYHIGSEAHPSHGCGL